MSTDLRVERAVVRTPLLSVENLQIEYLVGNGHAAVNAVADVSLTIAPGEVVAIVGESGSGKSSIAGALAGLLPANGRIQGGTIAFEGLDLTRTSERAWRRVRGARIGVVPQDPGLSLDPVKRIGDQVIEALTVHGVPTRRAREQVFAILAQVGLKDVVRVARSFPHELSGGMRQRVLIGIALANEPPLVIADEPTSALDVTVQRQVLDHMARLTRERGTAVLLITHDLGVAFDRADRVLVMQQGKIVEAGPTAEVFDHARHAYTRKLLAAAPGLAGLGLAGGSVPRPRQALAADTAPILSARTLVKVFGHGETGPAVDGVSFDVPRHGTTAIVGESGSGKSTTARMLLCLERPTSGEVWFDGQNVTHASGASLRAFRKRVQVVYQNPFTSLDPRFTLLQTIIEPLRAFGIGDARSQRLRVEVLLEQVELPLRLLESRPAALSGGQRQRVAIARALAIAPDLVVLDEPVSALDVSVQAQILDLLTGLQRELGVSYVFISHDLAVVQQIADHVVVLNGGEIVEQGAAARLLASPSHPYTQALLDDTPGRRYLDDAPAHTLALPRRNLLAA